MCELLDVLASRHYGGPKTHSITSGPKPGMVGARMDVIVGCRFVSPVGVEEHAEMKRQHRLSGRLLEARQPSAAREHRLQHIRVFTLV